MMRNRLNSISGISVRRRPFTCFAPAGSELELDSWRSLSSPSPSMILEQEAQIAGLRESLLPFADIGSSQQIHTRNCIMSQNAPLRAGLFLKLCLPVAGLGLPVAIELHFTLDDAVREHAGIFVCDRVVVKCACHAKRNEGAGDFAVADFRFGCFSAPSRRGQDARQPVPLQLQLQGISPVRSAVSSRHSP